MKKWISGLGILVLGGIGLFILLKTEKKPHRQKPPAMKAMVHTITLESREVDLWIDAMGTVEPAQSVSLQAEVSGRVDWVSERLLAGSYFKKGELILTLDATNYKLLLVQAESNVTIAESELTLEMGRQSVAAREWEIVGDKNADPLQRALALREPQLKEAQANLKLKKALRDKAKVDLERTRIVAPFNGVLQSDDVSVGDYINTGETLLEFSGVDAFHVNASIPADLISFIPIPGAEVKIIDKRGNIFKGIAKTILSDLDPLGKMARVLVEIKDPLNLKNTREDSIPLLLGDFVNLEIEARCEGQFFEIPREALHQGNQVWLVSDRNELKIQNVDIFWRRKESVYVRSGVKNGDLLVTTQLGLVVDGLPLELAVDDPDKTFKKDSILKN